MSDIELDVEVRGDEAARAKIRGLTKELLGLKRSGKSLEKLSENFEQLKTDLDLSAGEAKALESGIATSITHIQTLADTATRKINNVYNALDHIAITKSYDKALALRKEYLKKAHSFPASSSKFDEYSQKAGDVYANSIVPLGKERKNILAARNASDSELQQSFLKILSLKEKLNDAESAFSANLGDVARGEINLNDAAKRAVDTNKEIFDLKVQIKNISEDLGNKYGEEYVNKITHSTSQLVGKEKEYTAEKRAQIPTLDRFLRRWRWSQSLVLVTLNFLSRLGGQSKVLGGILNMLGTGFGVILNSILIPTIPFFVYIMGKMIDLAKWIDKLNDKFGYLGTILSGIIIFIGALVGGRLLNWIVTLISKVFLFGGAINFIKKTVSKLGLKFKTLKSLASKAYGVLSKIGGLTLAAIRYAVNALRLGLAKMYNVIVESVLPALKRFLFRSVACAGGATVLSVALGVLAGAAAFGLVAILLWKTGVIAAIEDAGTVSGRFLVDTTVRFWNWIDKIEAGLKLLKLYGVKYGTEFNLAISNALTDLPLIGGFFQASASAHQVSLDSINDQIAKQKEVLGKDINEGVPNWAPLDEYTGGHPISDWFDSVFNPAESSEFAELLGMTDDSSESLKSISDKTQEIADQLSGIGSADSDALKSIDLSDSSLEEFDTGGVISSTGLAVVHKGETITAATGTHGNTSSGNTVTISNPQFIVKREDDKELFRKFMSMLRVQGGVALR